MVIFLNMNTFLNLRRKPEKYFALFAFQIFSFYLKDVVILKNRNFNEENVDESIFFTQF